jgi:dienelactone hydrolase
MQQLSAEGLAWGTAPGNARMNQLLTTEQVDDVLAALRYLRARPDVDTTRVAVIGASFGGVLTLLATERDAGLRAAVAFAPAAMNWSVNPPLRDRVLEAARASRVPLLVVQAENDVDIGPVREIPAAARAAGRIADGRLYPPFGSIAGLGHSIIVLAPDLWRDDVLTFLTMHLR